MTTPDLGRHFLIGLQPSPTLSKKDRKILQILRPAGVVLFAQNFDHGKSYPQWHQTLTTLLAEVRDTIVRDRILVGIDHEGGRVCRTPPPITRFSPACYWPEEAFEVGKAMGVELASLGVNLSFAPVLDIHTNPANPVIGDRAFGADPGVVSRAGVAMMAGLNSAGVIACGKHFPGHGDTAVDSHKALPVLGATVEQLRGRELIPFREAIKAGMAMIMTAHLSLPAIDASLPATLSDAIVGDLLRREMGFEGVVISDDIGMKALSGRFEDGADLQRFFFGGSDMLLICAHLTETDRALALGEQLGTIVANSPGFKEVLARSSNRIDHLLKASVQHHPLLLDRQVLERHQRLAEGIESRVANRIM